MNCHVCQHPTSVIWHEGAYHAQHCGQCGLIAVTGPAATELYDEHYYVANYLSHDALRIAHFQKLLRTANVTIAEPLLDIGAGVGFFLQSLPTTVRATAIAVEPAAYARNHLVSEAIVPTIVASLRDLPPNTGPFATVTLWDVLAHVPDPVELLKTIHANMAPGGQLIIKTPHHPARLFQMARLLGPINKGRAILHVPAQRFHFTPPALAYLLRSIGFVIVGTQWVREAPVPYPSTARAVKEMVLGAFLGMSTRQESFLCIAGKSR